MTQWIVVGEHPTPSMWKQPNEFRRHASDADALAEATRLALKLPHVRFTVCEVVTSVIGRPVIEVVKQEEL